MQTERIAVTLRPRHGWESIDLGFRMVRTWWRPLFGAWILCVWPIALALHLALRDELLIALALVWWLKPLFDRIALHVLSEALFGHVPTLAETLRAIPGALRGGLFGSLTWMRFSPLRALQLPIVQLEHLRGRARSARGRLLAGRESRISLGLHYTCFLFEVGVTFGLVEFAGLFRPSSGVVDAGFMGLSSGFWGQDGINNVMYVLAMTLIEPFYVGAGFALYINRRVYLEGWDIDLVFRKLARRLGRAHLGPATLAILLALAASAPAFAEDEAPAPIACVAERPEDARACVEKILESPEFGTSREVEYWWPKIEDAEPEEAVVDSELTMTLVRLISLAARSLAWLGLALALLGIAYLLLRARFPAEQSRESSAPDGSPVRLGIDGPAETLPDDVVGAALEHWRAGDRIGALSLLYRGALAHLVRDVGVVLPPSATEEECQRIARRAVETSLAEDFAQLTRVWQYGAYGRAAPADAVFEDLCARWRPRLEPAR